MTDWSVRSPAVAFRRSASRTAESSGCSSTTGHPDPGAAGGQCGDRTAGVDEVGGEQQDQVVVGRPGGLQHPDPGCDSGGRAGERRVLPGPQDILRQVHRRADDDPGGAVRSGAGLQDRVDEAASGEVGEQRFVGRAGRGGGVEPDPAPPATMIAWLVGLVGLVGTVI